MPVTGVMLPAKGSEQFIDNVLASPQGALTGEKFEMFDTAFVVPGGQLIAITVIAVFAGIGAAVLPARRASKLNVLDAIVAT